MEKSQIDMEQEEEEEEEEERPKRLFKQGKYLELNDIKDGGSGEVVLIEDTENKVSQQSNISWNRLNMSWNCTC